MADVITPHLGLTEPEVGASSDSWGGKLNANLSIIDGLFANTGAAALGTAALLAETDPRFMKSGMIVMWSGAAAAIPTGWLLCDGTNGTPDLRDRFLVGAGGGYAPGATGGSTSQTITVAAHALSVEELPPHGHGISDPGHGHTLHDPGHNHNLNDPGHAHGLSQLNGVIQTPGFGSALAGGNTVSAHAPTGTDGSGTGMWLDGSGTGVWLDGAFTGIGGTQNTGSGAGHAHAASGSDNRPPYYALCFIMKA